MCLKTTRFREYAHYRWVMHNHHRQWGRTQSKLFLAYCLFFHWLNDFKRLFTGEKFFPSWRSKKFISWEHHDKRYLKELNEKRNEK